jgi:hypothetical protein
MARMCGRAFRDKRGISPVLSELLLTVIAVAAMSVATTSTYVITSNLRENMSERFIIEDLWFNNLTGNIDLYLRNVGKVAIQVSAVYLNQTARPFTSPFKLEVGKHGWLNVSYSWTSGNVYYVDILTNRGTHVGDYYEAL